MLKDGKYAAWFRTAHGQGTGIVHLEAGLIAGRDSFFTYGGSYEVEQERFTATLIIRRYVDGPPSVFGRDEVEVSLAGACNGMMATCSGRAREAPDVLFEATLIYSQDPSPAPAERAVVKLNADMWPKSSDRRLEAHSRPAGGFVRSNDRPRR